MSEVSEEQLTCLIAKISADAMLQEKFRSAADLDSTALMAQEAGFDVTKEDLIKFQAAQTVELSDEELEEVSGGATPTTVAAAAAAVLIVGKALISEV